MKSSVKTSAKNALCFGWALVLILIAGGMTATAGPDTGSSQTNRIHQSSPTPYDESLEAPTVLDKNAFTVLKITHQELAVSADEKETLASTPGITPGSPTGPGIPGTPGIPGAPGTPGTPGIPGSGSAAPSSDISLSEIINLGKFLWSIVEAGKPVAEVHSLSANALPKGITHWTDLQGWKTPSIRRFRIKVLNKYGMSVVDYTYRIHYTPGGNVDGKGLYLNHITAIPEEVSVAWGWKFWSNVTIPSVTNAGTRENPIAAAEILVDGKVETPFQKILTSSGYYMRGDGNFVDFQKNGVRELSFIVNP